MKILLKNWQIFIFIAFMCYGLFLRFDRLNKRELWNDENYQIAQIKSALEQKAPFFSRTTTYGDHTSYPGEYITTGYFLKKFGADKWRLLPPHLFFVLLGFAFLFFIMKQLIRNPLGWIICLTIIMVNKNLVYYAFEYRPYAVLPTLVLGNLFFAIHVYFSKNPVKMPQRIVLSLFMVFSSIYHAYGILFVMLPVLAMAGIKYLKDHDVQDVYKRTQILFVPLCISTLSWGWYASANAMGELTNSKTETFQFIHSPIEKPWKFFKGTVGNMTGAGYDWLYPSLLAPTVMTWVKHKMRWSQIWFLFVLVILPILGILLVDIFSHYWFLQRQFVWIIPLWALYIGWSWDSFYEFIRERFYPRS